jgi:hypothetical protein
MKLIREKGCVLPMGPRVGPGSLSRPQRRSLRGYHDGGADWLSLQGPLMEPGGYLALHWLGPQGAPLGGAGLGATAGGRTETL